MTGFPELKYTVTSTYNDLTIASEIDKPFSLLTNRERIGQNFFQNPIIPFVYERGYRQNFENAGFPGIVKEFEEVDAFFSSDSSHLDVAVDLSCGSGFMTRLA